MNAGDRVIYHSRQGDEQLDGCYARFVRYEERPRVAPSVCHLGGDDSAGDEEIMVEYPVIRFEGSIIELTVHPDEIGEVERQD